MVLFPTFMSIANCNVMYFSELLRHKMFEKIIGRDVCFSFFALLFVLHQSTFAEIDTSIL